MHTTDHYIQQLQKHYPHLPIDTVILNQDGQYNDVLMVNDELIFRFAKVPDAIKTLHHEVTILRCIQNRVSLAIPNPLYEHVVTSVVGEAFMGYAKIAGKPLWVEAFEAIPIPEAKMRLAVQLGGFLRELHGIPIQTLLSDQLPLMDTRSEWADLYEQIQDKLFNYMRPDARQQVTNHFEHFLNTPQLHDFDPVLRHGDFGPGNILFDPAQLSITGIIDFGGVNLGAPAVDFAALYSSYGEDFYQQCAVIYPAMAAALARVHFYRGTFALQEALFGIGNNDVAAFQNGIAYYL